MAQPKNSKKAERDKENAEKPVSLWGASFREVVGALLKTKPIPNKKDDKKAG